MANRPNTTTVGAGSQYSATVLNTNFNTIEDAVEGCLGRGGTSETSNSMTGNLDMDTNRIVNLGLPGTSTDAVSKQYVDEVIQAASLTTSTQQQNIFYTSDYGTTVAAFQTALTASSGARLIVNNTINITSDMITLDTSELVVVRGGGFVISALRTLTIQGAFSAGEYQIFSGAGLVDFNSNLNYQINTNWWATDGVNKAVAASTNAPYSTVNYLNGQTSVGDNFVFLPNQGESDNFTVYSTSGGTLEFLSGVTRNGVLAYNQAAHKVTIDTTGVTIAKTSNSTAGQSPSWTAPTVSCYVKVGSNGRFAWGTNPTFRGASAGYGTGNQSLTNSTEIPLQFAGTGNGYYDPEGLFSANTKFTIPSGVSKARFIGHADIAAGTSTGVRKLFFRRNGTDDFIYVPKWRIEGNVPTYNQVAIDSGVIAVTPGDYWELVAYQTSGTTGTADSYRTFKIEIIE